MKVAYVSGTRADFGLMLPILRAIEQSPKLQLDVYVTGIHLMPEFGLTLQEALKEFPQAKKIDAIFETDDKTGSARFAGKFLTKIVDAFFVDKPDFVLTLGDRPEMLCTALACLYLGVPTGHVHGGEKTSTVDELARHAITKLSHIHFPATEESVERIKKMGEDAWRVHAVGAPALDVILNTPLPTREEVCNEFNLDPKSPFVLVTQHPVSGEVESAGKQMEQTLTAVKNFNMPAVVVYPHADAGGRAMVAVIEKEKTNPLLRIVPSIPHTTFLALEREAAVLVGNSSGALIESASFKTPVVNVGTRQSGRQRGSNVLDTGYNVEEIVAAIEKSLYDKEYKAMLQKVQSPWGDGKTGPRVARILEELVIDSRLLAKQISY